MAGRAVGLLLAILPAAVSAYANTSPVIAWSSHSSRALSAPTVKNAASSSSEALAHSLYTNDYICDHDAVVIVDHVGLHASDLRALPPSSHVAKAMGSSSATLTLPYVDHGASGSNAFSDLAGMLAKRCGSRGISYSTQEGAFQVQDANDKHVVKIGLPSLEDGLDGSSRRVNMMEHESWLASELRKVEAMFPNYLVIYSGSSRVSHHARQVSSSSPSFGSADASAHTKAKKTTGGILARYQLFTPGLLLSLLVAVFVLVPVIFVGVTALSSIQSPLSNDIPKGFNADERKNQ